MSRVPVVLLACSLLLSPLAAQSDDPIGLILTPSQTLDLGTCAHYVGASTDDDAVARWVWDLGDGRQEEGQEIDVEYNTAGVYKLTLQITDEDDEPLDEEFSRWVFVNDPELYRDYQIPLSFIEEPAEQDVFEVGEEITFIGVSFDEDEDEYEEKVGSRAQAPQDPTKSRRKLAPGVTLYWDFDDGTLLETTQEEIEKIYESPCLKNDGFCAYEVRLFSRDETGLATVDPANTLLAVSEDLEVVPEGKIVSPVLVVDPNETFEFETPHFELRGDAELTLVGAVEGVDNPEGYTAFWTVHDSVEVFENGNQEAIERYEGFEIGPFTSDDFVDWNIHELVFFLFVESPDGVIDPIPDFMFVEVGNATPEGVLIVEPSFDIPIHLSGRVDLVGEAEDLEDSQLDYEWKVTRVDDGAEIACFDGPVVANLGFPTVGLYRITMKAFDRSGGVTESPIARYVIVLPDFEDLIEPQTGDLKCPPYADIVDPEEYQVLVPRRSRITFSTQADPENERPITNYFWDLSGQLSTDARPAAVSFENPGYNFVRCFVRDSDGLWSPDPVFWNVFVFTNNIPPVTQIVSPALVPVADEDEYYEHLVVLKVGESVTIKGMADDIDGDFPLSPLWILDDELLPERTSFEETFQFDEAGLYPIQLLSVDDQGEGDPFGDYRLIQVVDPNAKPRAYIVEPANDIVVEPGEPIFFAGFAEDPNDLDLGYQWDFGPAATTPENTDMEYVYPVVFQQESPEGEPFEVTLRVVSRCDECVVDSTPAVVRVTVRKFNDSELEPNNNFDEAKSLQQGNYGSLSLDPAAGDSADYFRFDVEEEEKDLYLNLKIEADGVPLTMKLYRLEADGRHLVEAGVLEAGSESVALESVPRGSYVVEVLATEAGAKRRMGLNYGLSLSTLQPSLFLPLLVEDGRLSSKVGIINVTSTDADIVITGLDQQGKSVTTQSAVLKANGRMFVSSESLFGRVGTKARARDIFWVRVQSTVRLLGYTNAETPDKSQLMSVGAVKTLSSKVIVPHIAAKTETWYTRAVMVNADEGSHPIDFDAQGQTREIRGKVDADSQVDLRFTEVYSENLPDWGSFKNRNNKASLAGYELFGRVDGFQQIAGLQMLDLNIKNPNFVRVNKNIYFTHIAKNPNDFWTGVSLINTGAAEATFNLVGYNDAGQEVVRMAQQSLPVGGKLLKTTQELFPQTTDLAWLKVETNSEMAGFELVGDPTGERLAGFQAADSLTDTLFFPHIQVANNPTTGEPAEWTGIALLNIDTAPVDIRVHAYADSGELVAETTETLAAGVKLVRTVQAIFPGGLPASASYIRVQADRRVLGGFELFGSLETATKLGRQLAGLPALRK